MKKLLFLFCSLLLSCMIMALDKVDQISMNKSPLNQFYNLLPESIYSEVENKSVILYHSGHYGCNWSFITRHDDTFRIRSGKMDYAGDIQLHTSMESTAFDTVTFVEANRQLFAWGIDTLPLKAKSMKPVENDYYITNYTSLMTRANGSEVYFDSNNINVFSGPDSIAFNDKFHKLQFLMLWLAIPVVRPYVADSLIYGKAKAF